MTPQHLLIAELEREALLADDLEADLVSGRSIILHLLARAKREALTATLALPDADATNVPLMQKLQLDVQRYLLLAEWVKDVVTKAGDAINQLEVITADERARHIETIAPTLERAPQHHPDE